MATKRNINKYEIETHENHWIETSSDIFLSWSGLRKLNGEFYLGPVYFYDESMLYSA